MSNITGDRFRQEQLLKARALESVRESKDSRIIEWILDYSEFVFSSQDCEEIYVEAAHNKDMNLRTFFLISAHSSRLVRSSLLNNQNIPEAVLYCLAFDNEAAIRSLAINHPHLRVNLSLIISEVQERHRYLFDKERASNNSLFFSYGISIIPDNFSFSEKRFKLLSLAYEEPKYWKWFSRNSGYTEQHLKTIIKEATLVPIP